MKIFRFAGVAELFSLRKLYYSKRPEEKHGRWILFGFLLWRHPAANPWIDSTKACREEWPRFPVYISLLIRIHKFNQSCWKTASWKFTQPWVTINSLRSFSRIKAIIYEIRDTSIEQPEVGFWLSKRAHTPTTILFFFPPCRSDGIFVFDYFFFRS